MILNNLNSFLMWIISSKMFRTWLNSHWVVLVIWPVYLIKSWNSVKISQYNKIQFRIFWKKIETFNIWFYKVLNHFDCIFSIFNSAFWKPLQCKRFYLHDSACFENKTKSFDINKNFVILLNTYCFYEFLLEHEQ